MQIPWEPKTTRECEARCVPSWSDATMAQEDNGLEIDQKD